ncbi:glycoside hydrolase family 32 protein [Sphingomonas lenta]|uniref:glycoside hydrolase family 32 protein n=1 Tax=Sphingomonas lenta TaxID=1141887 RepID=UPI001595B7BA|nr:glycoside hydrolase family 32 protein [Sphingomonas lenta]
MSYRFHAAALPGEWINDPNALFFADGRYHLYVQHAADAPEFKAVGWAHLSSPDLMDWRWEGVVMPPDERASIYSGSIVAAQSPRLFFTRHEREGPWQTQHSAVLRPDGRSVGAPSGPIGPAGRNMRDPFVFRGPDGWRMLVARPCDWTAWRDDSPSVLELWGSPDLDRWERLATIGSWSPPGVMWEVPALLDFGSVQALILSLVDRRADTAECEVRYWLGRMTDLGFAQAPNFPPDGVLLDHGPDFYAAIPNAAEGWPTPDRVVVGWASNWRTARLAPWPDARGGGPIAMPRHVELAGDRLASRPAISREPTSRGFLATGGRVQVSRGDSTVEVSVADRHVVVRRVAPGLPRFERAAATAPTRGGEALLFIDGPLVELFWNGIAVTAAIPGDGDVRIAWGLVKAAAVD